MKNIFFFLRMYMWLSEVQLKNVQISLGDSDLQGTVTSLQYKVELSSLPVFFSTLFQFSLHSLYLWSGYYKAITPLSKKAYHVDEEWIRVKMLSLPTNCYEQSCKEMIEKDVFVLHIDQNMLLTFYQYPDKLCGLLKGGKKNR